MRDRTADSGRYDATIRNLRITAIALTVALVMLIASGAYWWTMEERKLGLRKIKELKQELEICKKASQ